MKIVPKDEFEYTETGKGPNFTSTCGSTWASLLSTTKSRLLIVSVLVIIWAAKDNADGRDTDPFA